MDKPANLILLERLAFRVELVPILGISTHGKARPINGMSFVGCPSPLCLSNHCRQLDRFVDPFYLPLDIWPSLIEGYAGSVVRHDMGMNVVAVCFDTSADVA
jgi:hypothetical protein